MKLIVSLLIALTGASAFAMPWRRPLALTDCMNLLAAPERALVVKAHALYVRQASSDVSQIKLSLAGVHDVRARQSLLHHILRDHSEFSFATVRALIESVFRVNVDRREALYGWFLLTRSFLDVEDFALLTRWMRELAKPSVYSLFKPTPVVLPDLLALFLEQVEFIDHAAVRLLTELYPERGDEIWTHYLLLREDLLLDRLPHRFQPEGYLHFLVKLAETKPALLGSSLDEVIRRARQTVRPDLVALAYLDHAPAVFGAHDFIRLVKLAFPDLTRAYTRIETYLHDHTLSDINQINLLELLPPDAARSQQLDAVFKRLWAAKVKPAQIVGSVSALTARLARIHFVENESSTWELSRVLRYARQVTSGDRLREIVRANLLRRRENLSDDDLTQLLADLGVDFLLTPAVARCLSQWSSEGLSHWVRAAKLERRLDRRRLYVALVGDSLATRVVDWNELADDIKFVAGGNLGALALLNQLVEAGISDREERRRVKLRLITRAISIDGWNLALINLASGEAESFDGPALAELLQTLVRPRKDEVAAVLTAFLRGRTAEPSQTEWRDLDSFAESLLAGHALDSAVLGYLQQITPEAERERAIFGIQQGGPPRSGVIEREHIWLGRVAALSQGGRTPDLVEALTRLHDQAPALRYLLRLVDQESLSERDALAVLRALIPGELKLAFLRAFLLSDRVGPRDPIEPLIEELPSSAKFAGQILRSQITPLVAEGDVGVLVSSLHETPSEAVRLELAEKSLNKFYRSWDVNAVLQIQAALREVSSREIFLLRFVQRRLRDNPPALGAELNELLEGAPPNADDHLIMEIVKRAIFEQGGGGPSPEDVFRSVAARIRSPARREQLRKLLNGAT